MRANTTITCVKCGIEMTRDRWVLSHEYDNGSRYRRAFHTEAHCAVINARRAAFLNADSITEQGQARQRELSAEMRERRNVPGVDEAVLLDEYVRRFDAINAETVAQREAQNAIDHAEVMRLVAIYNTEQAAYRRNRREVSA